MPSPETPGDRLLAAAAEMVAVERGEAVAPREFVYEGAVLVEIRERGEAVWTLAEAGEPVRAAAVDAAAIRARLRQTQEGFAELLGVSVKTLRNWEQRQRAPRGPARRLLEVASAHPAVLLTS